MGPLTRNAHLLRSEPKILCDGGTGGRTCQSRVSGLPSRSCSIPAVVAVGDEDSMSTTSSFASARELSRERGADDLPLMKPLKRRITEQKNMTTTCVEKNNPEDILEDGKINQFSFI